MLETSAQQKARAFGSGARIALIHLSVCGSSEMHLPQCVQLLPENKLVDPRTLKVGDRFVLKRKVRAASKVEGNSLQCVEFFFVDKPKMTSPHCELGHPFYCKLLPFLRAVQQIEIDQFLIR
jgi:hypothetical protein